MLPANLSSVQASLQAKSLGGAGITTPIQLILPADLITKNLISTIASDSEVQLVATDHKAPFIKDNYQRIFIFLRSNFDAAQAHAFDQRLIHKYLSGFRADAIFLSGASIQADDLIHALGQQYLVAGLFFFLLWLFLALRLRSIWLPLKSHLLALTSTLAGAGIMAWLLPAKPIEIWSIVIAGLALFALALDYEIFLLSQIKLELESGDGLVRMAPVVLDLGIIFSFSLLGMIFGHFLGIREFGLALWASIIFDLAIIRLIAFPAAMTLLGDLNWWWPKKIAPNSPIE
jgi:hypothetical protein